MNKVLDLSHDKSKKKIGPVCLLIVINYRKWTHQNLCPWTIIAPFPQKESQELCLLSKNIIYTLVHYYMWLTEFPDIDNINKLPTSTSFAEKRRVWELHKDIPMVCWKANMVLAWLEVECQMPMYSQMCYENIKSGKVLLELSDAELEAGLGMGNTMHRRKLRLAIEDYRDPSSV